jgi:hypothetical protein
MVIPGYPPIAAEVAFTVSITVTEAGDVSKASIERAETKYRGLDLLFSPTLLEAVREWKYPPASQPRKVILRFVYEHLLGDGPREITIFDAPSHVRVRKYSPVRVAID